LSEAETKISRLETTLASRTEEVSRLREELNGKLSLLVSRDSEMEEFRVRATQQEARIRALHDQLASFIEKDAHEAARAQIAEQDLEETKKELSKRLGQLKKVVAALNALRQREASLGAALDAQTELAAQLQSRCSALSEEASRANESTALLEKQYHKALEEITDQSERIDQMEQDSQAKKAIVDAAVDAAERIEVLTKALKAAGEERGHLLDSLSNAKADARRETLALQRLADDRQAIIRGLQADLAAATSALSAASGANRAASSATTFAAAFGASAGSNTSNGDTMMLGGSTANGAGSTGRKHNGVGSTGGKAIVLRTLQRGQQAGGPSSTGTDSDADGTPTAASTTQFVKGPPGAIYSDTGLAVESAVASEAECVRLRLQVESLSRKVKATEDRLSAAQRDQEQLLVVNERLRVSLENSGGGAAAATIASSGGALTAAKSGNGNSNDAGGSDLLARAVAFCFARYVMQVGGFVDSLKRLLASLHSLRESCRSAMAGGARGGPAGASSQQHQLFGLDDLREEEEEQRRSGASLAVTAVPMLEIDRAVAAFIPALPSSFSSTVSTEELTRALLSAAIDAAGSPAAPSPQLRFLALPDAAVVLQKESVATEDLRAAIEERAAASIGDACATQ
jgi:predicted  nucleic acid-binding Zn-ribbon protein